MNANSLTTSQWLNKSSKILDESGIATARLDCLVLIEDATGKDRSWLLAHPDYECQGRTLTLLNGQIKRRAGHEPLAYIRGKSEFYGREFIVNEHTLEPRPETETMITLLKAQRPKSKVQTLVDVGTGSGCLALTAKLEFKEMDVYGTDISEGCLEIARNNAQKLGANITFLKGDLLKPLCSLDLGPWTLLANLPYVPNKYELNEAAKFEPKHAIFGGEDGLNLYREMFKQLKAQSSKLKAKYVLTESLPFQHAELAKIAKTAGYELEKTDNFIQVFEFQAS